MNLTAIIERLRATMPENIWGKRIAGAAEFLDAVEDQARLIFPSMYVILGENTATTLANSTYLQEYEERFYIVVVLDNRSDRRGQTAQERIDSIQNALWAALLNFEIDCCATSIQYVRNEFLQMDKARYFHRFEFKQIKRLDPTDGAQLELDNFDKFFANWELVESDPLDHPDAQDHITDIYNG